MRSPGAATCPTVQDHAARCDFTPMTRAKSLPRSTPLAGRPPRRAGGWTTQTATTALQGSLISAALHAPRLPPPARRARPRRVRGDDLADLERPAVATEEGRAASFAVERAASGFERPVWVGVAPGDPDALWIAEQTGRVLRLEGEQRTASSTSPGRRAGRLRAGPARHRVPPRLRAQRPALRALVRPGRRHPRGRVRPRQLRAGPRAAARRAAGGEPQRRPARLRPRRPAVPRPRRRRRRLRPERDGAGRRAAARQADRDARRRSARLADRAHRPAQPVALLVRPGARRGLDRRRRPGRGRGDRPRAARARRAAEEPRLERLRGHGADRGARPRRRGRARSGPSPTYEHGDGHCSVTGGVVYGGSRAARRWAGATSTATSAPARCGACAARPRAARRTSGARRRRCPSSPTSGPTPTASSCSRAAPATSTARCRPAR